MPDTPAPTPAPTNKRPKRPKRPKRGAGEGYVSQRKDRDGKPLKGQWRGELQLGTRADGKPDVRHVSGRTRKAVQDQLHDLREQQRTGTVPRRDKRTVGEHLDLWLRTSQLPHVSPNTYRWREQATRLRLQPAIGHLQLAALTTEHVRALLADLHANGLSRGSQRLTLDTLHLALEAAVADRLLARNVASSAYHHSGPRHATSATMRTLDAAQAAKLLDAARQSAGRLAYALLTTALTTGARLGELLALDWSHLAEATDGTATLHITRSQRSVKGGAATYGPPKGRRERTVAIPRETVTALRAWRRQQATDRLQVGPDWPTPAAGEHGLVFTHPLGQPLHANWPGKHLRRLLTIAGLPHLRWHDLRHTHATLALASGANLKVLSERLGHSSPAITLAVYAHVLPGQDQAAADSVARLLFGTHTGTA